MTACLPSGSTNGHDYELGWRHQTSQFKHADFPDVNLTGDLMMPNFLKPDTASSWGCDCAPQNPWHRIPKRMPKPSTALCQAGGCCFPTNKPRMLHFQFRCHMAECEIFFQPFDLEPTAGRLEVQFQDVSSFMVSRICSVFYANLALCNTQHGYCSRCVCVSSRRNSGCGRNWKRKSKRRPYT